MPIPNRFAISSGRYEVSRRQHGAVGIEIYYHPSHAANVARMLDTFGRSRIGKEHPERVKKILSEAIFTPACGLALHSVADAELVLGSLLELESYCHRLISEN